jgi:hypothetical protein
MKMRHMAEGGSLGFLIGLIAANCGGGETSSGRVASLSEAGSNAPPAPGASSAGDAASPASSDGGQRGVPQAFASVSLGAYYDPNHNGQNTCASYMSLREVFAIGSATGTCNPTTGVCNGTGLTRVRDGDSQSGGTIVNVKCSVTGGYDVALQASLGATGTLGIFGHVDPNAGGQGLSGDITYQGSEYQATNSCTVTFTYSGAPVPESPPIARGRIWAHLSCPQMGDPNMVRHVTLMDMSLVPEVCDGEVDFIFENCSQ